MDKWERQVGSNFPGICCSLAQPTVATKRPMKADNTHTGLQGTAMHVQKEGLQQRLLPPLSAYLSSTSGSALPHLARFLHLSLSHSPHCAQMLPVPHSSAPRFQLPPLPLTIPLVHLAGPG